MKSCVNDMPVVVKRFHSTPKFVFGLKQCDLMSCRLATDGHGKSRDPGTNDGDVQFFTPEWPTSRRQDGGPVR